MWSFLWDKGYEEKPCKNTKKYIEWLVKQKDKIKM